MVRAKRKEMAFGLSGQIHAMDRVAGSARRKNKILDFRLTDFPIGRILCVKAPAWDTIRV
jgi:hypothetical protein